MKRLLFITILIILLINPSSAHTFDTQINGTLSAGTNTSFEYTCGANATLLVLSMSSVFSVDEIETPAYNGVNFTLANFYKYTTGYETNLYLWYYLKPPIITANITIPDVPSTTLYTVSSYCATPGNTSLYNGSFNKKENSATPYHNVSVAYNDSVIINVYGTGWYVPPTSWSHTLLAKADLGASSGGHQYALEDTGYVNFTWTSALSSDDQMFSTSIFNETIDDAITYDLNVLQKDRNNESYNTIFELSNYSASLNNLSILWAETENGNTYFLKYWNGTEISNQTASSNNESLWFNHTVAEIPEGKYYISETVSDEIETFVLAAGAFAAVVIAGAAVVSRRVRRGISGFWNRRVRRR